ncbi:hypothetical protein D3C73_1165730 [compost metagenome]
MRDSLYIVYHNKNDSKPIILGAIYKINDHKYISFMDTKNMFKARIISTKISKEVPHLLLTRTYSPRRKDIGELLNRHGLTEFDAWELVKRTGGRLATDNMMFVSKDTLEKLGLEFQGLRFDKKKLVRSSKSNNTI